MAIEPIFEKIYLSGKRGVVSESVKSECKTMISTESVSEVLSVHATALILGCDEKDGQLKYDGRASFYVSYLAVDGEIKKTECSSDFSGVIKDGCIRAGYKAVCRPEILKTDFSLSGASLSVWASLKVRAELSENIEVSALSGGTNMVVDVSELTFSKSYGVKEAVYSIEEEFEINAEIKEVLCHRASASVTAVSSGVGSVIVDGQVYLSIIALQKSEKSSIIKEVRTIPFRMEIECEEAMPTMQATASVVEKGLKTEVLVDEESAKSKVTVSLNLGFTGEAWTAEEKTLVKDAFSTTDDIELVKEQTQVYKPSGSEYLTAGFNGRAPTDELPIGVSLFAVGNERAEIVSSELNSGKLKISGVVTAVGFLCDGEGKTFARKLETPFEKELDCNLKGELDYVCVRAERVTARLISATEIELDGELIFAVNAKEKVLIDCIKEIKSLGAKKENTHAISVYIPFENEELWSLAKRLNVCPESLVETNPDLTFPLTGEERIVVYRKL